MTLDASTADCEVFTFKEGLLSAVAHDLCLRVTRFSVDVDPEAGTIDARFDAGSLRVAHAMVGGAPAPGALGEADRRKIEQNLAGDVLDAARHPEIRFVSRTLRREGDGFRVEGELSIRGKTRPLAFSTHLTSGKQVAEITLRQPDFGIKPFSAMLGTLKIKPDVKVRFAAPEPPASSR